VSDCGTSIAAIGLTLAALATGPLGLAVAQPPAAQPGEVVPRDVRRIYDRACNSSPPRNPKTGPGTAASRDRP
jgi:hypothetical protein